MMERGAFHFKPPCLKTHHGHMAISRFIRLKMWNNVWEEARRTFFTHELASL